MSLAFIKGIWRRRAVGLGDYAYITHTSMSEIAASLPLGLRERILPSQSCLYLLCYIWQRYLQLNDNLIEAFCCHLKKFQDEVKVNGKVEFTQHVMQQQTELSVMRQLARLFVTEDFTDDSSFGEVREKAFTTIISKDQLLDKISISDENALKEIDFKWKMIDRSFHRFKLHLRPLMMAA